jgi:PAS domain S-box-containing protein
MFIAFSFSVILSPTSTQSSLSMNVLRYQLIFTETILLFMQGAIFHLLKTGTRFQVLLNSSIFLVLIVFSILVPDYVLFGEVVESRRYQLPTGDSILMINNGFTLWRAVLDLVLLLFAVSAFLVFARKPDYLNAKTKAILYSGIAMLMVAGFFDQMVDLGVIKSFYILPFAGFTLYMILSFIPFNNFVKVVNTHYDNIERDKKWQSLVSHADLLAVGLNRMGHVEFLSPYFYELTGYTSEEVLGKDWFEFIIPPKEYFNVQGAFVEILSYEFHPHYMNPILTKNKEERMIRWYNVRTRDQAGIITGSLSIGVDVSDDIKEKDSIRKKLKEAEDIILHLNEKIERH